MLCYLLPYFIVLSVVLYLVLYWFYCGSNFALPTQKCLPVFYLFICASLATDSDDCAVLVLLGLSAAFGTMGIVFVFWSSTSAVQL